MRLEITDDVHSAAEVMERARRVAVTRHGTDRPRPVIIARPVLKSEPQPEPKPQPITVPEHPPIELLRRLLPMKIIDPIGLIMKLTANHFSFTVSELQGESRSAKLVLARHIAMYLCRSVAQRSLPLIGRRFGDRDHTSVLHGCERIQRMVKRDGPIVADIEKIRIAMLANGY